MIAAATVAWCAIAVSMFVVVCWVLPAKWTLLTAIENYDPQLFDQLGRPQAFRRGFLPALTQAELSVVASSSSDARMIAPLADYRRAIRANFMVGAVGLFATLILLLFA